MCVQRSQVGALDSSLIFEDKRLEIFVQLIVFTVGIPHSSRVPNMEKPGKTNISNSINIETIIEPLALRKLNDTKMLCVQKAPIRT